MMFFPDCSTMRRGAPTVVASAPRFDVGAPRFVVGPPWLLIGTPRLVTSAPRCSHSCHQTYYVHADFSSVLPGASVGKHQVLQLSKHQWRTISWQLARILHPVIGSLIAHAELTSLAIDQQSSPIPNNLYIGRKWLDTIGFDGFHPVMKELGWFASRQMEWWKWSHSKLRCICQDLSITSHNLRSWKQLSNQNRWITTCLNLYNHLGKLIATESHVDELLDLDGVPDLELTSFTDIANNRCRLWLNISGHSSLHDVEKRLLCHCCLAHLGIIAMETVLKRTDHSSIFGQW